MVGRGIEGEGKFRRRSAKKEEYGSATSERSVVIVLIIYNIGDVKKIFFDPPPVD